MFQEVCLRKYVLRKYILNKYFLRKYDCRKYAVRKFVVRNYVLRKYVLMKLTNPNNFLKVTYLILRINPNSKEKISLLLEFLLNFKLASFSISLLNLLVSFQLSFLNLNYLSYRQCLRACGLSTALRHNVT